MLLNEALSGMNHFSTVKGGWNRKLVTLPALIKASTAIVLTHITLAIMLIVELQIKLLTLIKLIWVIFLNDIGFLMTIIIVLIVLILLINLLILLRDTSEITTIVSLELKILARSWIEQILIILGLKSL